MYIYVIYNIIHRHKAALGYSLLIKSGIWEKIEELICEITHTSLIAVVTKIKETNWYTNAAILVLEWHV